MQPRTDLIQWDLELDEPFIVLPSFPEVRLTPWRRSDADEALTLFNDPTIGKYTFRRPYPYLAEHLDFIWTVIMPNSKQVIDETLRPLYTLTQETKHPFPSPGEIPDCPSGAVRHVPSGKLIGDFRIFQAVKTENGRADVADLDGAATKLAQQVRVWEIAHSLSPGWRGKGLGGELLSVMIESWVSWVKIETLMAYSNRQLCVERYGKIERLYQGQDIHRDLARR